MDNGRWWLQQPLVTGRVLAGASMSPAGLLLTGGWAPGTFLSSTEVLKPDGWEAGPDMLVGLNDHCQVTVGSRLYVAGRAEGA